MLISHLENFTDCSKFRTNKNSQSKLNRKLLYIKVSADCGLQNTTLFNTKTVWYAVLETERVKCTLFRRPRQLTSDS